MQVTIHNVSTEIISKLIPLAKKMEELKGDEYLNDHIRFTNLPSGNVCVTIRTNEQEVQYIGDYKQCQN